MSDWWVERAQLCIRKVDKRAMKTKCSCTKLQSIEHHNSIAHTAINEFTQHINSFNWTTNHYRLRWWWWWCTPIFNYNRMKDACITQVTCCAFSVIISFTLFLVPYYYRIKCMQFHLIYMPFQLSSFHFISITFSLCNTNCHKQLANKMKQKEEKNQYRKWEHCVLMLILR